MPLPDSAARWAIDRETEVAGQERLPSPATPHATFGEQLAAGLLRPGLKEISSSWLYDPVGSALFEAITLLPEYCLTRADERVIAGCVEELVARIGPGPFVAELGSGSGRKTRTLLEGFRHLGPLDYAPIDVSASALEACTLPYRQTPGLRLHPTTGEYLDGLRAALAGRHTSQRALVLFLGSTIGNFERSSLPAFFGRLRAMLREGDAFLVGADLEKSPSLLEEAYDDAAGVTAAFNKNLLAHINQTFCGDFNLRRFRHVALYNRQERRIEMYLESLDDQTVTIAALGLRIQLGCGERIRTELSHKFALGELHRYAQASGFEPIQDWVDEEWPFAECLWLAR